MVTLKQRQGWPMIIEIKKNELEVKLQEILGDVSCNSLKVLRFEEESELQTRQRLLKHNLNGAITSLKYAVQSIEEGYRFEDNHSQAKIKIMQTNVNTLQEAISFLIELLDNK